MIKKAIEKKARRRKTNTRRNGHKMTDLNPNILIIITHMRGYWRTID
jgi:hypothetical protein